MPDRLTPTQRLLLCAKEAVDLYAASLAFREDLTKLIDKLDGDIKPFVRTEILAKLNLLALAAPTHSQYNYHDYTDGLRGKGLKRQQRWRAKTSLAAIRELASPETAGDIYGRWIAENGQNAVWEKFSAEIILEACAELPWLGEYERCNKFREIKRKYDRKIFEIGDEDV